MRKVILYAIAPFLVAALFGVGCSTPSKDSVDSNDPMKTVAADKTVPPSDVQKIAEEAYIYGYPLVLMDVSKEILTNVATANDTAAPVNQFVHKKSFPDVNSSAVVSPNADTLYSSAWLDVSKEPVILSLPDTGDRYYMMPLMSAWTDVFASPGSRTNGNGKADFAVVGPAWKGKLPDGVKEIRSPTNDVWLNGRTQTNGKADFAAVQALQKQYHLVPLSAWGSNYQAPRNPDVRSGVDMKTAPVAQVERMTPEEFFKRMAKSLKRNAPQAADASTVAQMVRIGLIPGRDFEPDQLTSSQRSALHEGAKSGLALIVKSAKNPEGKKTNGWVMIEGLGKYGTNYSFRAAVAQWGMGSNLPEDSIYFTADNDLEGQPLSGNNRYVIRFPKGQEPPVNAFWSVTLYNAKNFFAKNSINRYALGDRDPLQYNEDGSVDIYIQRQNPGRERMSNWLPTPTGKFSLSLRNYWPKQALLTGQWAPPPIQRVQDFKNLSDGRGLE